MSPQLRRWLYDREVALAALAVLLTTVFLAVLAVGRVYFTFGVETDYLGLLIPEAERVLEQRPLLVQYHPPLYPLVMALGWVVVANWWIIGILISLAAAAATAMASFLLFRTLDGSHTAWGALLGGVVSMPFIQYAVTASSHLFFVALFYGSCALAVWAFERDDIVAWLVAGVVIGLTLLSRANALSLLLLALAPLAAPANRRARGLASIAGGIALPLAAWAAFASATGSPFIPGGSHLNLAATYFSERASGEDLYLMADRFESLWDVLTYDPLHILVTYILDLYDNVRYVTWSRSVIAYPLNLLVLPGLLLLLASGKRKLSLFLWIVILPQLLLVNFKQFQGQYFLFLVPLFGAALGRCAHLLVNRSRSTAAKWLVASTLAVLALGGGREAALAGYTKLHAEDEELRAAIQAVENARPRCEVLYVRKPHLPFYTGCSGTMFPQVESLQELLRSIRDTSGSTGVYVYYGSAERRLRPQFSILGNPSAAPSWLHLVAAGDEPDWVLYRYRAPLP